MVKDDPASLVGFRYCIDDFLQINMFVYHSELTVYDFLAALQPHAQKKDTVFLCEEFFWYMGLFGRRTQSIAS